MFKLKKWLQLLFMAGVVPTLLVMFIAKMHLKPFRYPAPKSPAPAGTVQTDSSRTRTAAERNRIGLKLIPFFHPLPNQLL
ncbi:hypothetical protein GA0116948_11547 [Chitinophaga costaii]|uniref:Uncharacterized protein n=1 Tax=Chitinophaga costaii TaxID=1335309 RepID=A0A1C4FL35_9BACT|nr:hypothetical protein GA0116948_11547 [Chitinophaga costaii]